MGSEFTYEKGKPPALHDVGVWLKFMALAVPWLAVSALANVKPTARIMKNRNNQLLVTVVSCLQLRNHIVFS